MVVPCMCYKLLCIYSDVIDGDVSRNRTGPSFTRCYVAHIFCSKFICFCMKFWINEHVYLFDYSTYLLC